MMIKLNPDQVNYLNIGLMIFSAALAFRFPFELFLFSYTVLGPLHYLTEISWLHDRNYYTQGKYDYLFLTMVGALVTVMTFNLLGPSPKGAAGLLTCTAFLGAWSFAFLKGTAFRLGVLLPIAGLSVVLSLFAFFTPLFAVFLPTLIHVFVFTGLFLVAGALKGRSLSGFLSLGVFLALGGALLFFHGVPVEYQASAYARQNYGIFGDNGVPTNPFIALNFLTLQAFGLHQFGRPAESLPGFITSVNSYLYHDPVALALMAFIAYAYTYHYFNWFSKTSIIRWHEVSHGRMTAVLLIWGVSLGLSAYNYSLGFRWLFFLSFTHVLLEFPLNQLTLVSIGKEIRKIILLAPRTTS
jgi:hypothetical protein